MLTFLFLFSFGFNFTLLAQCEIGELEATPTPCDSNGFFNLIMDFDYANIGNQGFTIEGNGGMYGTYEYSDLPITIYHLEGDGTTFYEFVVRDVEFPDCHNYTELGVIHCDGGPCLIWNVDVFVQPCEAGFFYVQLAFWHENVGTEGFRVQGNGHNYGNFEYEDLPIMIGPLEGDGVTEYEFVVIDNEFEYCSDWAAIDPVECPGGGDCNIWDLVVDDHPCEEGMFNVYLNFEYENVSDSGFALYVNYDLFGTYSYDDLPLQNIGPFNGDGSTVYHFLVTDLLHEECAEDINFGPIDCGTGGDCNIWDVEADIMPCNDDGYFHVTLNFAYVNIGNEGFNVHGNGVNYGDFSYDDLPVIIGPLLGDGTTVYEFAVIDNQFEECSDWTAIDPVDCGGSGGDCHIWDLVIDDHPCESGMFNVYINFFYENVSDTGFALYVNYDLYGYYNYNDLPLGNIGPFNGDGSTVYHFLVTDIMHEECAEDANIGPINCNGGGDCEIGAIGVTILPCNDDDEFNVLLDFDYANTSDEFTVVGNGAFYGTFLYANLPVEIGPLLGDGTTIYEFGVHDVVHDNCGNANHIDPVHCDGETAFLNFTTQVVSCDNEMYELQLNFDVINPGDLGFMLVGNGEDYGSYDYTQLPVTIGPLATDGYTPYHFIAKDKEKQNYGNWDRLIPFTCASLGVDDAIIDEEIIKVYPNPSHGTVIFENLYGRDLRVHLSNSAGSETTSFSLLDVYQVNGLNSGIYYYRIVGTNAVHASGKIVVTR